MVTNFWPKPSSRKKQQGVNGASFREDLALDPVDQVCSIFAQIIMFKIKHFYVLRRIFVYSIHSVICHINVCTLLSYGLHLHSMFTLCPSY